jgi:magnesium transporter
MATCPFIKALSTTQATREAYGAFSPYCLTMLLAVCQSAESGWTDVEDLSSLSDLRAERTNLLMAEADVSNLTHDDVSLIAEEFDLHALAVEDAVHTRQRPKLESYQTHLFMVMHQLDEEDGQLEAVQIACFVGDRYVLIMHASATRTLEEFKKRWRANKKAHKDPSHLVHTLVDVVVDDYQDIADRLETEVEELEEIALTVPTAPIQRQLYSLKQRLARLRRYVLPAARLMDWALDPHTDKPFSPETAALFNDVRDHLLRITDEIRNIDDLSQAVLDLNRSEQAAALNEVTRRLSAWAAIFAVETVIAGIYGMNFELVPFDGRVHGFWFAIIVMLILGIALYAYFKRRGWL